MITVHLDKIKPIDPELFLNFKILDIGCGSGRHICEAVRFNGAFAVGADTRFETICDARNNLLFHKAYGCVNGTWSLLTSDITRLPFKDQSFDVIICSEVLEHIPDESAAVQELVRVLKKGKYLIISVPRRFPEQVCWILSPAYAKTPGGHIRIYNTKELIDLFVKNNVKEWHIHFAHSLHTPYWWLKCLADRLQGLSGIVSLYHRFLVWDLMKKRPIIRWIEEMLNPLIGKSVVVYFKG